MYGRVFVHLLDILRIRCDFKMYLSMNRKCHNHTLQTNRRLREEETQKTNKMPITVRKAAKIRKRYNQVPHLTQDTIWKSNKNTINITNKSQEVSPFPAGDHKAAMNRHESTRNTRHKKHK